MRDLTAAALHRMSQPLTVLRGTAELALIRPLTAEEYRQAMLTMARETERLVALAQALRALHAPAAAPSPVPDPHALLQGELQPLAAAKGVQLALAAADLPPAWCEPVLQLGYGALERARQRLHLRADGSGGTVIEDDGAPLDATAWEQAFDPFAAGADIAGALRAALARRQLEALGAALATGPSPEGGNQLRVTGPQP